MNKPVIEFKRFGFQYNAQAKPTLFDIDLTIRRGEKALIVGPSGSGKSTLASCVNGLIPERFPGAQTGSLRLCENDVKDAGLFDRAQIVGTVLQDPDGQFVGLTVGEDIAFSLENSCTSQEIMKLEVKRAAGLVGIDGFLERKPFELSGGQKQRVSLAGVLVDNIDILLFDEPLANLDPATGRQAIALIDDISRKTGVTVIIIEHRLEDVLYRAVDRILLVDGGRLVADMPPDALLAGKLLVKHGIREPLYITALKYAGVAVTEDLHPAHIDTLKLDGAQRDKLLSWYHGTSPPAAEKRGQPLLSVEGVSFAYTSGMDVLRDVTFMVNKGEMLAIAGANGAGKSTLSKLICGFIKPREGVISLDGRDLKNDSITQRAQKIGYVMQNPNQMISKTMIFDEVALGLRYSCLDDVEKKERVYGALEVCGLYPFRNWPISALSFGQKKRVTIASILALGPSIIILDEPTAGQDFKHYTEIMAFLQKLNASGVTVIMITHDMHLMLEYTPRALVFADGRLIRDDSPARVLSDEALCERASLKETSLYTLAERLGISERSDFVQHFIDFDRAARSNDSGGGGGTNG